MPQVITRIVRTKPDRPRSQIRLMVLHTTEGANRPGVSDLEGLASYFQTVEADATYGVDAEGNACRMLKDEAKPWTQSYYNWESESIEAVGFAATTKRGWIVGYNPGLYRTALILADWHQKFGIPLRHSTSRGVCQHKHLGNLGGGHHDCGPAYPQKYVTLWARYIVLRRRGKRNSPRARLYRRRIERVQKRYGLRPTTSPF